MTDMLDSLREQVTERLTEVLQLLRHVRAIENTPPEPDPPEAKILRGLVWVHLYAALEFTVTRAVQEFLQHVQALSIPPYHLETRFHSVALDASFKALRNVGDEKTWKRRLDLLILQSSASGQEISNVIFDGYLQNVWCERLDTVFDTLALDGPIVPDPSFRPYVDELVEFRNGVAHGRYSALGLGSARRADELLVRHDAISATCSHILDSLEQHYLARGIVAASFRELYAVAES